MSGLMNNVFWVLGRQQYNDYDDFINAATDYNKTISPENNEWSPDQKISDGPITVVYEAKWKDEDDKIELKIGEPGQALTMGRLLFVLNNETCKFFQDADHRFFEGLSCCSDSTYRLHTGS
jgi:hypothetical protein